MSLQYSIGAGSGSGGSAGGDTAVPVVTTIGAGIAATSPGQLFRVLVPLAGALASLPPWDIDRLYYHTDTGAAELVRRSPRRDLANDTPLISRAPVNDFSILPVLTALDWQAFDGIGTPVSDVYGWIEVRMTLEYELTAAFAGVFNPNFNLSWNDAGATWGVFLRFARGFTGPLGKTGQLSAHGVVPRSPILPAVGAVDYGVWLQESAMPVEIDATLTVWATALIDDPVPATLE